MVLIYIYLIDLVQTLATLQFAERASRLVNVARANEILDDQAMLQKAHSEIARLKGRVNVLVRKLKAANSGMGSLDSQANKIQAFVVSLCILHAFAHYYIYSYTSTVCDHTLLFFGRRRCLQSSARCGRPTRSCALRIARARPRSLGCAQDSNAVAAVHVSNRVEEVVRGEVVVVFTVGARAASKRTPTRHRSALRVADSRAEKLHRVSFHFKFVFWKNCACISYS